MARLRRFPTLLVFSEAGVLRRGSASRSSLRGFVAWKSRDESSRVESRRGAMAEKIKSGTIARAAPRRPRATSYGVFSGYYGEKAAMGVGERAWSKGATAGNPGRVDGGR